MLAAEGSAPRNTLGCNASTRTAIETIGATGTVLALTPSLLNREEEARSPGAVTESSRATS